jgi:hypothetical protein
MIWKSRCADVAGGHVDFLDQLVGRKNRHRRWACYGDSQPPKYAAQSAANATDTTAARPTQIHSTRSITFMVKLAGANPKVMRQKTQYPKRAQQPNAGMLVRKIIQKTGQDLQQIARA